MGSQSMNLTLIDEWNLKSVETISYLQTKLFPYEWWILQCSHLGDNREAFTFFFPLFAGFLNVLGIKVLWAAILSEWLNLLLKWLFKGDRPYWWVQETSVYSHSMRPSLRQFPNTCESGPGTPSGHLMINVALFYVVFRGISKHYIWGSRRYRCTKTLLSTLVFIVYALWISLTFVSRLYIQTHFVHQCVLGVLVGLLVGHISWSNKWLVRSHTFGSTVFASFLVGSAALVYIFLTTKGLNPLWAVPLAEKYCANPEFVNIDQQPYHIIVKFAAMALSLGFATASRDRKIANSSQRSFLRMLITIKLGLLLGRGLSMAQKLVPKDDLVLYHSANFGLQMLFPYMVIVLVPYAINGLFSISRFT